MQVAGRTDWRQPHTIVDHLSHKPASKLLNPRNERS
jgi:hypothetical protein